MATSGSSATAGLHGRVALVTGAARGIGLAIASALAEAGADVAVTARSAEAAAASAGALRHHGVTARGYALDLLDRTAVPGVVQQVEQDLGAIDVLVCNSGVSGPSKPVWDVTDEDWDEVLAVNVTGPFACVRAVAPGMVRAGSGSIVLIGSMTGKRPLVHRSPYAMSKMATVGLCRTLALDLGPSGVRVNLVSPGFIDGDRLAWILENQAQALGSTPQEVREQMAADTPLRRLATGDDVAAAVVYLAGDASAAVTGEDLNVSSGLVMF
ncbi:MAG TPA: SDR family NAD(P)-dependent oxidoreductase [Actinomycetales bacterium]